MRIETLTGIRGLAALWVILFHTYFIGHEHASFGDGFLASFAGRGWLGVDLFFVLSGFVISHVYTSRMAQFNLRNTSDFYLRRFAKIYPAHLFVLGLFLILYFSADFFRLSFNREHYAWDRLIAQIFMLNGLGLSVKNGWNYVSWSISAEFAAYLLYPIIAVYIAKADARRSFIFGVLTLLTMFGLAFLVNGGSTYFLPWRATLTRVLSEFLLGAFAYKVYQTSTMQRIAHYVAPIVFVAIVMVAGFNHAPLVDGYLVVLFSILIPSVAADQRSLLSHALQSQSLVYLGEISFSVYLIQNLVEVFVNAGANYMQNLGVFLAKTPLLNVAINASISIIAGAFIYEYIERKAQKVILTLFADKSRRTNV